MRSPRLVLLWLCLTMVGGLTNAEEVDAARQAQAMDEFRERVRLLTEESASQIERAGLAVRRDVVYQEIPGVDAERLSLDLYLPGDAQPKPAAAPIVLYLHGGGWQAGAKELSLRQPLVLVPEGFAFASANYRFRPEASVKEMAQSAADAVGWLKRNAEQFGGDPNRIFLIGHSAGAHLVSLLGTNASFLVSAGVDPASIRGVISLDTAVYDLPKLLATDATSLYGAVFGANESLWEEVSPWHHVQYDAPPAAFLIFYSQARPQAVTQTIPFGERLRGAGHTAQVVEALGRDHGQLNTMLGTEADMPTARILEFLHYHAGASTYVEGTLDTALVPSPLEYSTLRPGKGRFPDAAIDDHLPILLFLHGGNGDRSWLARSRRLFEQAWERGLLPPMVVATPSSSALSYYMDFHDGSERWTTFLAGEFPEIIAERHGGDARRVAIAGYSMGGVGALRVAFKNPEGFIAAVGMAAGVDPAIEFDQLPPWYEAWKQARLGERFGTPVDAAFWAANNPASIAAADPDRLRNSGLAILVECGAEDQLHNYVGNEFLHRVLTDQRVAHEYRLVLGEAHVPVAPERLLAAFEFLARAVRGPGEAQAAARAKFDTLVGGMRAMGPPR